MFTWKIFQLCGKTEYFYLKYEENSTQQLKKKVEEISQKKNKARRKKEKDKKEFRESIQVVQWLTNRYSRKRSRQKEGEK